MIGSAPRTSYVYTTTASSSYWASALTRGPGIRENLATSRGNFRGMLPTLLLGPLAWPGPLIHVHAFAGRGGSQFCTFGGKSYKTPKKLELSSLSGFGLLLNSIRNFRSADIELRPGVVQLLWLALCPAAVRTCVFLPSLVFRPFFPII